MRGVDVSAVVGYMRMVVVVQGVGVSEVGGGGCGEPAVSTSSLGPSRSFGFGSSSILDTRRATE